jgi:hypothetical protein
MHRCTLALMLTVACYTAHANVDGSWNIAPQRNDYAFGVQYSPQPTLFVGEPQTRHTFSGWGAGTFFVQPDLSLSVSAGGSFAWSGGMDPMGIFVTQLGARQTLVRKGDLEGAVSGSLGLNSELNVQVFSALEGRVARDPTVFNGALGLMWRSENQWSAQTRFGATFLASERTSLGFTLSSEIPFGAGWPLTQMQVKLGYAPDEAAASPISLTGTLAFVGTSTRLSLGLEWGFSP